MSKRSVISDMKNFADAVESLAFMMKPPNPWTPQFVELVVAARKIANDHDRDDRREREAGLRKLQQLGQEADAEK